MKFRFEPARKNDEPVGAVILYNYRFELKEAPRKRAEQAEPVAAKTGVLAVQVAVDDTAIAGATVVLRASDGKVSTEVTDGAGRVRFVDLAPGKYQVEVEAAGYRPYTHAEQALAGSETTVKYALLPEGDEIEVVVRGEARRDVSVRRIPQEEFALVPGSSGDPIRVVESLPGVARTSDGTLVIRGANPFFSGVMIDGMAVPFLYHIYQITSVVPADMVEDVTLYPGNYGVRYGRYVGGLVEVGLQSPNTRCTEDYGKPSSERGCYHGLAQLDFIEGRLMLEGPVPGTKHWSFAVSGRRSWLDFMLEQVASQFDEINLRTAPRYRDGYAMVEYEDDEQKLSARAYGSLDEVALIMHEPGGGELTSVGRLEYDYGFERYQALYRRNLGDGLSYSSMLGVGRDHITMHLDEFDVVQRSHPIAFRHEILTQPSEFFGVNVGLDLYTSPYRLLVRLPDTDALTPVETTEVDGTDATFGVFAELPIRATKRARIVPGFRVDHTPLFDETTFSPRVLATYDLVLRPNEPWLTRTTLKGGAGLYHQAPPVILRYFDENVSPQSMRSRQYSLGIEQELTDHLEVSLEGFYIDRDRIFSPESEPDGSISVANEGVGETIGLETFLRFHSHDRFFGWIAYTLSDTWQRETPDEPRAPADFDQRHNLIALGSLDLGRGWRLGARYRYVTGNWFTDIARPPRAQSLFDGQTGEYVPQYTAVNAERLPDVHQLDARVDKKWTFRHWALTLYLDVRNALNRRVVDYYNYNWDYSRREPAQGLPILPNLGVKGEF